VALMLNVYLAGYKGPGLAMLLKCVAPSDTPQSRSKARGLSQRQGSGFRLGSQGSRLNRVSSGHKDIRRFSLLDYVITLKYFCLFKLILSTSNAAFQPGVVASCSQVDRA
jgi:hypothetical protein